MNAVRTTTSGAGSAVALASPEKPTSRLAHHRKVASVFLTILIPLVVWFAPLGLDRNIQHVLAITAFMIVAWATEVLDHTLTGFIGCYLYWAFGLAKFGTAFGGFADDTPWFIFGGMLIGAMVTKTGLARRLAYWIMRPFGNGYSRLLFGLLLANYLLMFLVPSLIARIIIMAAIALGLIDVFGVGKGSNIGRAMFVTITLTGGVLDKSALAGAASITAHGLMEKFGGVSISYNRWLLAFLPFSAVTIVAVWRLALWMYPPERKELPGGANVFQTELEKMGKWTVQEKRALLLTFVALALWFTDSWHHLSPSMVGLGVGLLAVLPGVGVLTADDMKRLNLLPMFFVATVLSMGQVLVSTKALDLVTDDLFRWLSNVLQGVYGSTTILFWSAFCYHFLLASELSMLATSMPLLMNFASSHGLNPITLGLVWTFAAGGKIFIYQSAITILGYSYGYFNARDVFRVGLFLTLLEFVLLFFLVPFYWPLIGIR